MPPSSDARVICCCPKCKLCTYTDGQGIQRAGREVNRSTRTKHYAKANRTEPDDPTTTPSRKGDQSTRKDEDAEQENELRMTLFEMMGFELTSIAGAHPGEISMSTMILAVWLHLHGGLSRDTASRALGAFRLILDAVTRSRLALPPTSDIRSAMRTLSIEPNLNRTICCPTCFKLYSPDVDSLPLKCEWKFSPQSHPCNTSLFTTSKGRRTPSCYYTSQSLDSWLEFFLSQPGIEDELDKSYAHQPESPMRDVWDSPAWESLGPFCRTPGNLTFSFFIDWFNPYTNKIAGKHNSVGAMMMFCLNLPPHLRYRPQNIYFIGLTPGPKEPSVDTINHILQPVVDQLVEFSPSRGKIVRSHRFPNGRLTRIALLPLTGDLPAVRKTSGFAGHAAEQFCSWCKGVKSRDLESLEIQEWAGRESGEVLEQAREWNSLVTRKAKQAFYSSTGVRWSEFHRLEYRDHVRHVMLGVMHNWLEGVIQYHVRKIWGLGGIVTATQDEDEDDEDPKVPGAFPRSTGTQETYELEAELLELQREATAVEELKRKAAEVEEHPSTIPSFPNFVAPVLPEEQRQQFSDSTDSEYNPEDDADFSSSGSDGDGDSIDSSVFDKNTLIKIRQCIKEVTIPTWLARPPLNLGQKMHGKLKANDWFVLITVFLPMVLVELWATQPKLLENFYDLVACTNILCSYSVSDDDARRYTEHYHRYRTTLKLLYPRTRHSKPNHHYAMHNGDLMRFWGPLIRLSEFGGERVILHYQRVKLNYQGHGQIEHTMLNTLCRRTRIQALGAAAQASGTLKDKLFALLFGPKASDIPDDTDISLTDAEARKLNLQAETALSSMEYNTLHHYLNSHGTPCRHARNEAPHPVGSVVLPRKVITLKHFHHSDTRLYSCQDVHTGNSTISVRVQQPGEAAYQCPVRIESIWRLAIGGRRRTILSVQPFVLLKPQDQPKSPFVQATDARCMIAYATRTQGAFLVEPNDIIGHLASRVRPRGTWGIAEKTVIFHLLSRGWEQ